MKIINDMVQGSDSWHELRSRRFTASEAAAACGDHKYMSRDDLLKQKATGFSPEISAHQQRIFDQGHKFEEMARPIAEEIIGEELFPCTCEDDTGTYLASMDGLDMGGSVGFEHKSINEKLRTATIETLEEHYKWQMDHQILVTGAETILFMASNGTKDDCNWFWYDRDEKRIAKLVAAWDQFAQDLKSYVPQEEKVDAVGVDPESLPTLRIELTGSVSVSNLPEYKKHALSVIEGISTELATDEDFATAEKAVKFLKKGEEQLEQAKAHALEKTASIDELFKTIDELKEAMRAKRLAVDKLVKAEKENRRVQILTKAKQAIDAHIGELEKSMEAAANCPVSMPAINADFASAMKGKKTISSLESAANDTLATAKIEANQVAEVMRANIAVLNEQVEYGFLFSDYQQLLTKANDDFVAVVKSRIAEHKEAEAKRLEAQREQIRKEEEAKAQQKAEEAKQPQEAPAPVQPTIVGVDPAQPGADSTVTQTVTASALASKSSGTVGDKVFNVAVNAVASYFNVSPAEAVDMLDAIDFSERKAS